MDKECMEQLMFHSLKMIRLNLSQIHSFILVAQQARLLGLLAELQVQHMVMERTSTNNTKKQSKDKMRQNQKPNSLIKSTESHKTSFRNQRRHSDL